MQVEVKTIGASGQLSLGKEHAGRTVTVESVEKGVWLIRTARVIPENERWLHTPRNRALLNRAVAWAEKNPASKTDLEAMERKLKRRRR
jgi:hypothetical protein